DWPIVKFPARTQLFHYQVVVLYVVRKSIRTQVEFDYRESGLCSAAADAAGLRRASQQRDRSTDEDNAAMGGWPMVAQIRHLFRYDTEPTVVHVRRQYFSERCATGPTAAGHRLG